MKTLAKILTKNFRRVPLLMINFDLKKYEKNGAKGSCDCVLHPVLSKDEHIIKTMEHLCDYIREYYHMEDIV